MNFRNNLRIFAAILLAGGLLGVLLSFAFKKEVNNFVWFLLVAGVLLSAALFRHWPRFFAWVANGLGRAGNAAAPHINAGAHRAGQAIGNNLALSLAIFLGILTLVFFGVWVISENIAWLRMAVVGTFLTTAAAITAGDGWGFVRANWLYVWLGLSLLFIPLTVVVFGGTWKAAAWFAASALMAYAVLDWGRVVRNWDRWWLGISLAGVAAAFFFGWSLLSLILFAVSALFAFITVMGGWRNVGREAGRIYFGGHGWYLSGGAYAVTLAAVGFVLFGLEQSGSIPPLPRKMFFGEPYPEVLLVLFGGATLIASVTALVAVISEVNRSANDSAARATARARAARRPARS